MFYLFKDKLTQDFMRASFGNILEWYDFALYGLFALPIAQTFFPTHSEFNALILVFLTFAIGFIARPLGSFIFGYLGDSKGRRYAVNLSMWWMAIPTVLIGCLPGYNTIGCAAPLILVTLRILQGISTGGQFSGLITIAADSESPNKAFLASLIYSISVVGSLLASLIGSLSTKYFDHLVSSNSFIKSLSWRFPFWLSGLIFILYLIFKPKGKKHTLTLVNFSFASIFKHQPKEITYAIMLSATTVTLYYILFIYLLTYMQIHLQLTKDSSFLIMNSILLLSIILYPIFGYWRKSTPCPIKAAIRHLVSFIILISLFLLPGIKAWFNLLIFSIMIINFCAIIGYTTSLFAEIFDKRYRMTACSISYSIGCTLAGFAPLIAEIFAKAFKAGLPLFLLIITVILFIALHNIARTAGYIKVKLAANNLSQS